ncbi:MAG: hypothetical protein KKA38_10975 [Euryarchaeota archaeon]|nr:hypothetical protein [Euryarchaeota archaeon]MBV1734248.1 hypothetical protein [Desulforudis sp.]
MKSKEPIVEVLPAKVHPREGKPASNAHPPEVIEEAIEMLCYHPVAEVARKLGISRTVLMGWRGRHALGINSTRAYLLSDKLDTVIQDTLDRISGDKLDGSSAHSLAIIAGILTDKKVALLGPQKNAQGNFRARVVWKGAGGSAMALEVGSGGNVE